MLAVPTVAVAAALLSILPGLALGQSGPAGSPVPLSAMSGPAPSQSNAAMVPPTSEGEARQRLERGGYRDIQNLRPDGDAWMATARRNGKDVMLVLDSHGAIEVMR